MPIDHVTKGQAASFSNMRSDTESMQWIRLPLIDKEAVPGQMLKQIEVASPQLFGAWPTT